MNFKVATRLSAKLRICVAGVAFGGKTKSSLFLAYGLTQNWSKVCVIDAESGAASLHAGEGNFLTATLPPPYSPDAYIKAIEAAEAEGFEVIIIDGISPEWAGKGGCLQIHNDICKAKPSLNSFTAWGDVTPKHEAFVAKIQNCKAHVIATVRLEEETVMQENNGKKSIVNVGLQPVQRKGLKYEFDIWLNIQQPNTGIATVEKDRTNIFLWDTPQIITKEHGKMLRDWCDNGTPAPAQEPEKMATGKQENELLALLQKSLDLKIIKKEDYDSRVEMINTHKYTEEKAQRAIEYLTAEIKREEGSHD